MSISTTLSIWNDVEIAIPLPKRSMPHSITACGSSPSNSIESSPASSSSINSNVLIPPPPPVGVLLRVRALRARLVPRRSRGARTTRIPRPARADRASPRSALRPRWRARRSARAGRAAGPSAARDVGDDEVLLPRQADVAAIALGQIRQRDHLVAGDEAEVHRHADVREAFLLLRVHAEVVRRLDVDRGQRVVLDCAPELCLDAL